MPASARQHRLQHLWRALRPSLRSVLLHATVVLVLVAATLLAVRAFQSTRGPDLRPWHKLAVEEPDADAIHRSGWSGYLASEARVFAEVRQALDARMTARDANPLNRYTPGSNSSPARFPRDWNRSYTLLPEGTPRGAAVLLHGLTDAPYSMLSLARLYRDHGYVAIVPRMPGHGTVPAALARVDREQWVATVDIALAEARKQIGPHAPLHLVGYSNGAALALSHTLVRIRDHGHADADRLVLLSPMFGVTRFARFAGLAGLPALLPRYAKAAWLGIVPEYNPFKYNSFPAHAARESYLVTSDLQAALAAVTGQGRLDRLPPILAFQSVVDDTVDAVAVPGLFDRLPSGGHALVLFDVHRSRLLQPLQDTARIAWAGELLRGPSRRYAVTLVGARSMDDAMAVARIRNAGSEAVADATIGIPYPAEMYSLSHIALPFAPDDPLYGHVPSAAHPMPLGSIALRGERNALLVAPSDLQRLGYNPFHAYQEALIAALLAPTHADANETRVEGVRTP